MRVSSSKLSSLAGLNHFVAMKDAWLEEIETQLPTLYAQLKDRGALSKKDELKREAESMPSSSWEEVKKARRSLDGGATVKEAFSSVPADVSEAVRCEVVSDHQRKKGLREEETGLACVDDHLRKEAETSMTASESYVQMVEEKRQDASAACAGLDAEIRRETERLVQGGTADVTATEKKLAALLESKETYQLSVDREVAQLEEVVHTLREGAELKTSQEHRMTRAMTERFKNVVLVGKVDSYRMTDSAVIVTEHKRRQRRLLKRLYDNEKIQCFSYMYMMQKMHPGKTIRCQLSETFGEQVHTIDVEYDEEFFLGLIEHVDGIASRIVGCDADRVLAVLGSLETFRLCDIHDKPGE